MHNTLIAFSALGLPVLTFYGMAKLNEAMDEQEARKSYRCWKASLQHTLAPTPLGTTNSPFFSLSIVIPAYNEAERLPQTLEQLVHYLKFQPYKSEILVVDDGSTDTTASLVKAFIQEEASAPVTLQLLQNPRNYGKGASVQHGFLQAKYRYSLLFDADGATPIQELERLLKLLLHCPYSMVIGSRVLSDTTVVRKRRWWRNIMGRVFNQVTRLVVNGIHDTQCGFKLLPTHLAQALVQQQHERGFAMDVELLHLAQAWEVPITEVPVHWVNQSGSKIHPLRDSWRMFWSVVGIFSRSKLNHYHPPEAQTCATTASPPSKQPEHPEQSLPAYHVR